MTQIQMTDRELEQQAIFDKLEQIHFMQCRLGDSCDRCKRFLK